MLKYFHKKTFTHKYKDNVLVNTFLRFREKVDTSLIFNPARLPVVIYLFRNTSIEKGLFTLLRTYKKHKKNYCFLIYILSFVLRGTAFCFFGPACRVMGRLLGNTDLWIYFMFTLISIFLQFWRISCLFIWNFAYYIEKQQIFFI